jgi:hypothetical protein
MVRRRLIELEMVQPNFDGNFAEIAVEKIQRKHF